MSLAGMYCGLILAGITLVPVFLGTALGMLVDTALVLALHPDDPPMEFIRGQPRLVYQPRLYQRVIDLHPSPANTLEFCIGSLAEMTDAELTRLFELSQPGETSPEANYTT